MVSVETGFEAIILVIKTFVFWFSIMVVVEVLKTKNLKEYIKIKYFDNGELYSYSLLEDKALFNRMGELFLRIKYNGIKVGIKSRTYEFDTYGYRFAQSVEEKIDFIINEKKISITSKGNNKTILSVKDIKSLKERSKVIQDLGKIVGKRDDFYRKLKKSKEKYEKNPRLNSKLW